MVAQAVAVGFAGDIDGNRLAAGRPLVDAVILIFPAGMAVGNHSLCHIYPVILRILSGRGHIDVVPQPASVADGDVVAGDAVAAVQQVEADFGSAFRYRYLKGDEMCIRDRARSLGWSGGKSYTSL